MWPNPQFPAELVTFTEEIPNWKLHFGAMHLIVTLILMIAFLELLLIYML